MCDKTNQSERVLTTSSLFLLLVTPTHPEEAKILRIATHQ